MHTSLNLQPPSELLLSVKESPQSCPRCKVCVSLHLNSRTKTGRSLGDTHINTFASSSDMSPHLANSETTPVTSLSHISPPSRFGLQWNLYQGRDLTLLDQCLHNIINPRINSPTRSADHPVHSHGENGATTSNNDSTIVDHVDKSQSLNVTFFSSPNRDRSLLSPCDIEGRPHALVG